MVFDSLIRASCQGCPEGTAFDAINNFLLRLYCLYEKSLKQCRELEDVSIDLKNCLIFHDAGVK